MATRTISFNVMLSPEEKHNLEALSELEGRTMGSIIRSLISKRHTMSFAQRPYCADGDRCLVPQMHAANQAPTPDQGASPSPGATG